MIALPSILNGQHLIEAFGVAGLFVIIFAETGLLLGFFLPGDSLLFAAGYAASPHEPIPNMHPSILVIATGCTLMAICGGQVGYLLGRAAGPTLFAREESRLFKRSHIERTEKVLERYGVGRALVLARFIPIARTFINPLVGVAQLPLRTFVVWNVVGGLAWGAGLTGLGYCLGQVGWIGRNLEVAILLIAAMSTTPLLLELRAAGRARRRSRGQPNVDADEPDVHPTHQFQHLTPHDAGAGNRVTR